MPARAEANRPRIQIEHPEPIVDCGRYPAKRTVGDTVRVGGHLPRRPRGPARRRALARRRARRRWREAPLAPVDADHDGVRWEGSFPVDAPGRTQWTIEAWTDVFAAWRDELDRKVEAARPTSPASSPRARSCCARVAAAPRATTA